MEKIYLEQKHQFKTIDDLVKFVLVERCPSFSDKSCEKWQCSADKNRSFSDILNICKTYFPSTNTKSFLKSIIRVKNKIDDKEKAVLFLYCKNIQKVIVTYSTIKTSIPYGKSIHLDNVDELIAYFYWYYGTGKGFDFYTKGNDNLSLRDIFPEKMWNKLTNNNF